MSDVPRDPNPYDSPPPIPAAYGEISKDVRNWAMVCHLSALIGYVLLPFGHVIGPLIVWLLKKDEHPFIDANGKESLNFQISITIYAFVGIATTCLGVGFAILLAVWIAGLVLTIIAAIKASNGEAYQYPLTIRFVK